MHTGEKMSGAVCKCMDCAGARFERAKREARLSCSDFYDLEQELAEAERDLEYAQERLKTAKRDMHDTVMVYYHDLARKEEADGT